MSKVSARRALGKTTTFFTVLLCLSACESSKEPIVLDQPKPPSSGTPAPGGKQECFVNFQSLLQLKVSANPAGEALEVLDSNPIAISSIPIAVNGTKVSIAGEQFPDIILTRLSQTADLRFGGVHGTMATGTYDPETGAIEIDGMQFTLEVLQKGKTDHLLDGQVVIGNVKLTTDSVTANGNLHSIAEQGKALDPKDKSLALVLGVTFPRDFSPLTPLNNILGGGALSARFDGHLDNLPENCGSAANGNEPPPGQEQPPGLQVSVEGQVETSKIDFGFAPVALKNIAGKPQIDCSDAEFRGLVSKFVTIKNVDGSHHILKFDQPHDSDGDIKSPLCSGDREFFRGSLSVQGGTVCKSIKVAGKDFSYGDCDLPPGGSLAFPMMYLPNNFLGAPPGQDPALDTAEFSFDFGGVQPFVISLSGRTIPDVRDVFSISKINNGVVSPREIRNKGSLKIALDQGVTLPFTQKLLLKNAGMDAWEEVKLGFKDGSVFSGDIPLVNRLDPANGTQPGVLEFELHLNPGKQPVVTDTLTVSMVKVGSRTEANPVGIQAQIAVELLGTVGVPRLTGKVLLQFDFLTALIDHSVIDAPLETVDYRTSPELAPLPLVLNLSDSGIPDFQSVDLETHAVDVLDPALAIPDRIKVLRIFSSSASVGSDGQRLVSNNDSDKCREAVSLLVPYKNGDCSYFYQNILDSGVGLYDSESGHLELPGVKLRMENPYHADILGRWAASNPQGTPTYQMDATLNLAFTTHILDRHLLQEGGREIALVPDERIDASDLVVQDKRLGEECPEGYLDDAFPHLKCYLSTGNRYLQGHEVTLRDHQTTFYDVVLVGVGRFPPGGPDTSDPNLPWFLGDSGGSRIYIAIQGRMHRTP